MNPNHQIELEVFERKLLKDNKPFHDLISCKNINKVIRMVEKQRRFVESYYVNKCWHGIFVGNKK